MSAHYEGKPLVEFLSDGRNVRLAADLTFFDPDCVRWAVPSGAVVDGASIPKVLWSIIGGPFEGNYRDASIIHDWYCDKRTRTWQATHRVFYDAMLVSGVSGSKAKVLYFAVRWMGPRWEERVTLNTNLTSDTQFSFIDRPGDLTSAVKAGTYAVANPGADFDERKQLDVVSDITKRMEHSDLSIEEIDDIADNLKAH